jgi:hypothetical protein
MVCQFIAAQAQVDTSKTGGRNPLLDLAMDIDIFGEKSEEQKALDAMRGEKVADRVEDDPRFGKIAANPDTGQEADNGQGSYEAFMTMFGGPPPMPGRDVAPPPPEAAAEPAEDLRSEAPREFPELR